MIRRLELVGPSVPSIHLLSPEDYMNSFLTRVSGDNNLHTLFAWLGFGTLVRRKHVSAFMALVHDPSWRHKFSEGELRMLDNYFTLLSNRESEVWIDMGNPLNQEEAFTVGDVGDDRNWKYTVGILVVHSISLL